MSWRSKAAPIIERVLKETSGRDEKEIRAALSSAYPFGQRANHPYKIWLDEIKRQRGLKTGNARLRKQIKPAPGQGELFQEAK